MRTLSLVFSAVLIAAPLTWAPTAAAAPGCDAAGLFTAIGAVGGAGNWLSSHPAANEAVSSANEKTIRSYFAAHPDEWMQFKAYGQSLASLRGSCPQQVSATQISALIDAMAS